MLNQKDYIELIKIAEKATEYLHEQKSPDFLLYAIYWDDDDHQWIVCFTSDYGNSEFINLWVSPTTAKQYRLAGHSFEEPDFKNLF